MAAMGLVATALDSEDAELSRIPASSTGEHQASCGNALL